MYLNSKYQIKDIENLTGIKAHTIRIWESRFNIVTPKRTDTNIRYYDENDLRKLLMISFLNKNGLKISDIATLSNEMLKEKINIIYQTSSNNQSYIDSLISSSTDLDELKFEKDFNKILIHFGFEKAIINVIEPFLEKIEMLWNMETINTAQKNYIYNLLIQKIIEISAHETSSDVSENKRFIIFSANAVINTVKLSIYTYYLKKQSFSVFNLGSDFDIENLIKINDIKPFKNILLTLYSDFESEENYFLIEELTKLFPNKKIFVIDYKFILQKIENMANLILINNFTDFIKYLKILN